MVCFFAGLPHWFQRQPWSGPHPVLHLLVICNQAPIRIKVAEERSIAGCAAKRYSKSRSAATSLSSKAPWPVNGPQKNVGTLSCPWGGITPVGLQRASLKGLMTGADPSQKAIPTLIDAAVKQCANHHKGLSPALRRDHRFTAKLMRRQLLPKFDLIAHDVVAHPCQLVTQRSGGQY